MSIPISEQLEFCRDIALSPLMIAVRSLAASCLRFCGNESLTDPRSNAQFNAKSIFSL